MLCSFFFFWMWRSRAGLYVQLLCRLQGCIERMKKMLILMPSSQLRSSVKSLPEDTRKIKTEIVCHTSSSLSIVFTRSPRGIEGASNPIPAAQKYSDPVK